MLRPLCCCALLAALSGGDVELLDGGSIEGGEFAIEDSVLVVDGTRYDLADVHGFQPAAEPVPPEEWPQRAGDRSLRLVDGSYLPLRALVAAEADDEVRARTPFFVVDLPLVAVAAWGRDDWLAGEGDREGDVVLLESGELTGTVVGIAGGELRIDTALADDPLSLEIADVLGLRLDLPGREPRGLHLASHLAAGRPPALFTPAWPPALAAVADRPLEIDRLPRLEVRGGRRVALRGLEPAEVEEEGAFGKVWPHRWGENLDGTPLLLRGRRLADALVVHSRARIGWDLDREYSRFHARIGIADLVGTEGDCDVRLLGDGTVLWEARGVRGGGEVHDVAIEVDAVERLTLVVDYGRRYDIGDHLVLVEPWLLRKAEGDRAGE